MARDYIFNQRKNSLKEYYLRTKECSKLFDWRNHLPDKCAPLDKRAFISLANSSKFHYNPVNKVETPAEYCQKPMESSNNRIYHERCTDNASKDKHRTSMLNTENDPRSAKNIQNIWKAIHCRMNHLSRKLRLGMFFDPILDQVICNTCGLVESISPIFSIHRKQITLTSPKSTVSDAVRIRRYPS